MCDAVGCCLLAVVLFGGCGLRCLLLSDVRCVVWCVLIVGSCLSCDVCCLQVVCCLLFGERCVLVVVRCVIVV